MSMTSEMRTVIHKLVKVARTIDANWPGLEDIPSNWGSDLNQDPFILEVREAIEAAKPYI